MALLPPISAQMMCLIECGGTLCVRDDKGDVIVVCRDCTERVYALLVGVSAAGPPPASELVLGCANVGAELLSVYAPYCVSWKECSIQLMRDFMQAQLVLLVDTWHFASAGVREEHDRRMSTIARS